VQQPSQPLDGLLVQALLLLLLVTSKLLVAQVVAIERNEAVVAEALVAT
jgi:Ca2+/Na+ antiporter